MIREHVENGVTVRLDLDSQVIEIDAPEIERYREPELSAHPTATGAFVSGAVLAHKAKLFDDALYADVELFAQRDKSALFGAWADAALAAREHGDAACVLYAACELGGFRRDLPDAVAATVARTIAGFVADSRRSMPVGFYTQSPELSAIFQQDRMLMQELPGGAGAALATLLESDTSLHNAYQRALALARELTNPARDDRVDIRARRGQKCSILLPSRSHEGDLMLQLYGAQPIPDGFDLLDELMRRVQAGTLPLAPRADSGWYDHQCWALEPLLLFDRTPERARLAPTQRYHDHLKELFKSVLALTRETHIKQLEPPVCGAAYNPGPPKLFIAPQLDVEPLATYYVRRAAGYRFVRDVLRRAELARNEEGLDRMQALFHGAHVRVCRQLGMQPDASALPDRNIEHDEAYFCSWSAALERDADLGRDSRMMVPVFYDLKRQQMKVWALLGWSERPIRLGFHTPPRVLELAQAAPGRFEALRRRFRGSPDQALAQVEFTDAYHQAAAPVCVELYVDRVLDREAFRALCDRHKTESAIVQALRR